MFDGPRHAVDDPRPERDKCQVVGEFDGLGEECTDLDIDLELLPQFATQRSRQLFSGLDLATRKFPQTRNLSRITPLRQQKSTIGRGDGTRDDGPHAHVPITATCSGRNRSATESPTHTPSSDTASISPTDVDTRTLWPAGRSATTTTSPPVSYTHLTLPTSDLV